MANVIFGLIGLALFAFLLLLAAFLYSILYTAFAPFVMRLFYHRSQAIIRDYYIYAPTPGNTFDNDMPVLELTLQVQYQGASHDLRSGPVEAESILGSLGLAGQLPYFWYEKPQWDQLLLGKPIEVAVSPGLKNVIVIDQYHGSRKKVIAFTFSLVMLLAVLAFSTWWHVVAG